MKQIYIKILKFILLIPLIPTIALGVEKNLNWEGYLMVYLICAGGLAASILLLRLLYYIFK